jgi:hypothetical protein
VGVDRIKGLYKGIAPLWARQIPYTMVKFATFETTVSYIYRTLGRPKESYSRIQQTGVSFLGGYIAGVGCAVISHPADVMVSKLNADRQRGFFRTREREPAVADIWLAGESAGRAVTRIYGNIGFKGLWNGLPVRIFMIGTLTVRLLILVFQAVAPGMGGVAGWTDGRLIGFTRHSNGSPTTASKSRSASLPREGTESLDVRPWTCFLHGRAAMKPDAGLGSPRGRSDREWVAEAGDGGQVARSPRQGMCGFRRVSGIDSGWMVAFLYTELVN